MNTFLFTFNGSLFSLSRHAVNNRKTRVCFRDNVKMSSIFGVTHAESWRPSRNDSPYSWKVWWSCEIHLCLWFGMKLTDGAKLWLFPLGLLFIAVVMSSPPVVLVRVFEIIINIVMYIPGSLLNNFDYDTPSRFFCLHSHSLQFHIYAPTRCAKWVAGWLLRLDVDV